MCNELTQLPADFGNLTGLRLLGLKSNKLAALPDSFTRLQSLVELFITDNKLVTLPTGVYINPGALAPHMRALTCIHSRYPHVILCAEGWCACSQ